MRIFKKENEITIFEDEEIETVKACDGFTQPGTSELTNCYAEGCYSFENSASEFSQDLYQAINEKFKKISLEGLDYYPDYDSLQTSQSLLKSGQFFRKLVDRKQRN